MTMLSVRHLFMLLQVSSLLLLLSAADSPSSTSQSPQIHVATAGRTDQEIDGLTPQLEASFLSMFGLRSRPRFNKFRPPIPQAMMELYKQAAGLTDHLDTSDDSREFYPGTTVRSFHHTEDGSNSANKATLRFNVTIPHYESLDGAELRIMRFNDSSDSISTQHPHRLDLWEIMKPATSQTDAIMRLLDTKTGHSAHTQWERFDVSYLINKWRNEPSRASHGLHVTLTHLNGQPVEKPQLRLRRSADLPEEQWHSEKPILMTFSSDLSDSAVTQARNKRDTTERDKKDKRKNRNGKKKMKKLRQNHCQRHTLYVDFSSVKWDDWIIAPPGYDAFFCEGECPFTLHNDLNTTNHAIIRNLVNSKHPVAPPPCCVPTELSNISLLYYDENDKVVLKIYPDMKVEACGCL